MKQYLAAGCLGLLMIGLLGGCTPAKARAIQTGSTQFRVEANQAIDLILETVRREVAPAPRTQAAANRAYVDELLKLTPEDLRDTESQELLETAIDPYTVQLDPATQQRINEFGLLKSHYTQFAEAFVELDQASMFAGSAIKQSAPLAKKLTVQMVLYAQVWSKAPPQLLQHRSAVLADFENVMEDSGLSKDEKAQRLLEIKERWQAILAEEKELQKNVVEQCLKAAALGRQLSKAIDEYDDLSMEDVTYYINLALDHAGAISGKDMTKLRAEAASIITIIERDPVWKQVATDLLAEVNQARKQDAAAADDEETK